MKETALNTQAFYLTGDDTKSLINSHNFKLLSFKILIYLCNHIFDKKRLFPHLLGLLKNTADHFTNNSVIFTISHVLST